MIKTFCDVCKKEITGKNVGRDGYSSECLGPGKVALKITAFKGGVGNEIDLCLACSLKMLNQKPKRKYTFKEKVEQVSTPPAEVTPEVRLREMEDGSEGLHLLEPAKKEGKKRQGKKVNNEKLGGFSLERKFPDISTFSSKVGQGDEPHVVCLGDRCESAKTLKECVLNLFTYHIIDRKYVEDAPDSEGKKNLLDILDAGK